MNPTDQTMPSEFTKTQNKQLQGMAGALADFNALYAEMSSMQMRVFIAVARRGPLTGRDIATSLSMSGPNVSRCVAMLSDVMIPSRKTQSLGLVELSTDPMDRRVRYVQLSQKGEEFVNQITANF